MGEDLSGLRADPALVEAWLRGRSVSRGLPQPEPDRGGLRLETGSQKELRRWVFAAPGESLRELAEEISDPRVALKLCAPVRSLRGLVPPRWEVQPQNYMMTRVQPTIADPPPLPPGLRVDVSMEGPVAVAQVLDEDGTLAASGRAACWDEVMIYDQISTEPAHRRRGLGRAVMAALERTMSEGSAIQVLAATPDGRALYASIGFQLHAGYSTALISLGGA